MSLSSKRARGEPPQPPQRYTTTPLNPQERFQQRYEYIAELYRRGRRPKRPASKTELDVLKEKHQFIRSNDRDPATLTWEDRLALKYYDSLFREFAIVNLKHYKSGAVALRWRTENELLDGIGHLTCASMRCDYHLPAPHLVVAAEESGDAAATESPLVETRLDEQEMLFAYHEDGVKKSSLVKVVLCRECGKKLKYGRKKAKRDRERTVTVDAPADGDKTRSVRINADEANDADDFAPALPPDLDSRHSHSYSRSRRRSASPERRSPRS